MIKVNKLASPIKDDGGAKLGALTGAIIGAILFYLGSMALGYPDGTVAALAATAGLIFGLVIGIAIGAKLDFRLTPKAEQGLGQDNMAVPKKHSKGRMH